MTEKHGFELVREDEVVELNAQARLWRHVKTGAELLSMELDDENKVFGIVFRTPPTDSTGLPHIMEHAVLAGSQKYPLKEPFIELVKGSLATFINAMTSPDKTTYPAASTNLQDFYNLLDVYADAVFHPLITPQHLAQEGWHYEIDEQEEQLNYKGVVFNEMKGAYSSPDNLLYRHSQQSLFPDTTYSFDSGGDPTAIPDLTYEQFKTFHETYYHPSNALIFFYGDDDPDERLRRMDGYLSAFDAAAVEAQVDLQPAFVEPQRLSFPYSVSGNGDGEGREDKAMVQVNWLLPEYDDMEQAMALEVLSHALLDTPASPLRKALIDSGLGEDLTGGGLSTYLRQMTFSAGLKGVAPADTGKVEPLILETLATLADEGFDPDMIEAAVNTIEFMLRENNTGRYPRGLAILFRSLGTWLHGRDPLAPLAYEAPLAAVKERLAADAGFLPGLIREHLLDNSHRLTVTLEPDAALAGRLETDERARLDDALADMDDADIHTVIAGAQDLELRLETPDSPAILATLPRLGLEDLDREHKPIPLAVDDIAGSRVLYHDLFTNGLVYYDLGLDLRALPEDLLPYAGLFGQLLLEMGTETEDYVKLSQRIGRKTGGIDPSTFVAPVRAGDSTAAYLLLRAKSTLDQAPEMLDILRDVLLTVRLDNRERFRQIVLEAKAGHEAQLAPAGHIVVNSRLRAHFNEAFRINEIIDGVEQLFFLRGLVEAIDNDWPGVLAQLEAVRQYLINRQGLISNVTLDAANYAVFEPQLTAFLTALPEAEAPAGPRSFAALPAREGLAFPAQVNYVGKGANLYELGYELDGSISVIANQMRTSYLWEKIRMQGGAYGAFSLFSRLSGIFAYLSYRDPNLTGTLANFDGAVDFLRRHELSDDELTRSIIGAIGTIDAYELPDAKGYTSLTRYLTNESDDFLQAYRDQVLGTTAADFRALADVLEQLNAQGDIVVLGSAEALGKANGEGLGLAVTKVL